MLPLANQLCRWFVSGHVPVQSVIFLKKSRPGPSGDSRMPGKNDHRHEELRYIDSIETSCISEGELSRF
jgi:hypothetical protein